MSVKLESSYLNEWNQKTQIGASFISWKDFLVKVLQGSILIPLLFKIFLCDLFVLMRDIEITSYADENNQYIVRENIDQIISA